MKEEKRIVLFLEKEVSYNTKELADRLGKEFPKLGRPIFPTASPVVRATPLIVFNSNDINLVFGRRDISFTFERSNEEAYNMLLEIMDVLEEYFSFVRMGYVSSYEHTKKERENFIENVFLDKKMITSEFQLSWYKEELIDSVKVNVWERHITDIARGVQFISIFDINTPISEKNNINRGFIESFIKKCDKFIVSRIKDRF